MNKYMKDHQMKLDSWNWHDDNWMDTHAALSIEGHGKISIKFFLRAKLDLDVEKTVAIFDGDKTHIFSLSRGFLSQSFVVNVNGVSRLRILFDYPEPIAPGDARTMLGAICVVEAIEGQFTHRTIGLGKSYANAFAAKHPENDIVQSSFDAEFYKNSIAEVRNGVDPILDYLTIGCRTGMDPSPDFSTNAFIESSRFDPDSSLSAFSQSILTSPDKTKSDIIPIQNVKRDVRGKSYDPKNAILKDVAIENLYGDLGGWESFLGDDNFTSCLLAIDTKMRAANVFLPCHPSQESSPAVHLLVGDREITCSNAVSHHKSDESHVYRISFDTVYADGVEPAKTRVNALIEGEKAISVEAKLEPRTAGAVEVIGDGMVSGWAIDFANPPEAATKVGLMLGGTLFAETTVSKRRGDVGRAFHGRDRSGFSFSLPAHKLPPGMHIVSVLVGGEFALRSRATPEISGSRVTAQLPTLPADRHVAIVVPVYNAPKEVEECMQCLLKYTPLAQGRASIILLDDKSPDEAIAPLLASYADHPSVTVYMQPENVGYTGNINRGIAMAGDADVVLLNSDARVGPGWLTGLRTVAAQRDTIGTVTALSDNAGAFSAPVMNTANPPPASMSEEEYARAVRQMATDITPVVPTGSGFCMYIKRDMLNEIGDFDDDLFPRGYGEENEFCLRALYAGWENVVADGVMVFHERSASFKAAKDTLITEASALLPKLFPEYKKAVRGTFLEGADLKVSRYCVALARGAIRPRPRIAFVIGVDSGGTPQTNMDLMSSIHGDFEPWLILCLGPELIVFRVEGSERIEVERHTLLDPVEPIFHGSADYQCKIIDILQRFKFELVHIRHIIHHGLSLLHAARRLDIPVVFSLHDFYTVCPNVKLLDAEKRYCGGRCTEGSADCQVEIWSPDSVPPLRNQWVHSWQKRFGRVLKSVDHLVTTSPAARAIVQGVYGEDLPPFSVIEHGRDFREMLSLATGYNAGDKLRIVVPGNIGDAKGLSLIEEVHKLDQGRFLEFHFVGKQQRDVSHFGVNHGTYKREDLPGLISDIAPHVGVVLSIWPETYSHTLTELWSCGLPVIGGGLGATGERIRRHGGGWPLDDMSPEALYKLLLSLIETPSQMQDMVTQVEEWQSGYGNNYGIEAMAARYRRIYWRLLDLGAPRAHALDLTIGEGDGAALDADVEEQLLARVGPFRLNRLSNASPEALTAIAADGVDAIVLRCLGTWDDTDPKMKRLLEALPDVPVITSAAEGVKRPDVFGEKRLISVV